MFKMRLGYSGILTALLVLLSLSLFVMNFACKPPAPRIDPVMEKAQQDSIRQIELKKYQFELAKNFSTGYEYYKNRNSVIHKPITENCKPLKDVTLKSIRKSIKG